jgi:hypothetical protein
MHVRGIPCPGLAQPRPLLQTSPQQTWPLAPHGSHVAPASPAAWHERFAPQESAPPPAQQAAPRLPHASHVPIAQRAPEAVQVIRPPPARPPAPPSATAPPQQLCPTAPHAVPAAV